MEPALISVHVALYHGDSRQPIHIATRNHTGRLPEIDLEWLMEALSPVVPQSGDVVKVNVKSTGSATRSQEWRIP